SLSLWERVGVRGQPNSCAYYPLLLSSCGLLINLTKSQFCHLLNAADRSAAPAVKSDKKTD
ncbi:hypothetical protein, partial [Serratia fonticola]|uniref:hypothetical protein n=1 Tax=Serratia fonticola TaxID=47917 RepID=UPI001C962F13